ncbi:hypothetical protein [Chryseobacterium sp. OV279]|nr:hypothetical protein [Chryseobacterium sp. OV279]
MRTAVQDQTKTGRCYFSRTAADKQGNPAGQLLLKCRVIIQPNRRNIEADVPKY